MATTLPGVFAVGDARRRSNAWPRASATARRSCRRSTASAIPRPHDAGLGSLGITEVGLNTCCGLPTPCSRYNNRAPIQSAVGSSGPERPAAFRLLSHHAFLPAVEILRVVDPGEYPRIAVEVDLELAPGDVGTGITAPMWRTTSASVARPAVALGLASPWAGDQPFSPAGNGVQILPQEANGLCRA